MVQRLFLKYGDKKVTKEVSAAAGYPSSNTKWYNTTTRNSINAFGLLVAIDTLVKCNEDERARATV